MKDAIDEIKGFINEINFKNRPIHISYKFRTVYQVSRLVLIIGITSTVKGCSILKAQILSSALDDERLFDQIVWLVNNNSVGFIKAWKYNQLVSTAINYSNADQITSYSNTGKIILTEKGKNFFSEIMSDEALLSYEKSQLGKIKKRLSDTRLLSILEKGRKND